MIQKLLETAELFYKVNEQLIRNENMKRGLGKGHWKSTKEFREATRLMDRLIWFTQNVRVQPINNIQGDTTTLYAHFMEEESTRLERDTTS